MGWHEIEACLAAQEAEKNEQLVMLMNCMAIAYGGTAKDRRNMASILLGKTDTDFDPAEFESMFAGSQFLATPAENEEKNAIKEWALSEFDVNDPAFSNKK